MEPYFLLGRLKKCASSKYITQPLSPFFFNINRCKLTRRKNTSVGVYAHSLSDDILYLLKDIEDCAKLELTKHAPIWFSNINGMDIERMFVPILNKNNFISTCLSKSKSTDIHTGWYFVHVQVIGVVVTNKSFELITEIKYVQEILEELPWKTKLLLTNFKHNRIHHQENEGNKEEEKNDKTQESVLEEFVLDIPPISKEENVLKLRSREEIIKDMNKIST